MVLTIASFSTGNERIIAYFGLAGHPQFKYVYHHEATKGGYGNWLENQN